MISAIRRYGFRGTSVDAQWGQGPTINGNTLYFADDRSCQITGPQGGNGQMPSTCRWHCLIVPDRRRIFFDSIMLIDLLYAGKAMNLQQHSFASFVSFRNYRRTFFSHSSTHRLSIRDAQTRRKQMIARQPSIPINAAMMRFAV